ncbi:MAG: sigma 54-interacting transcriptional regulator [Myxococcales bacterium]|nr:sigma 54-interacting transcriptional regulator [Myxococcales bacterium]
MKFTDLDLRELLDMGPRGGVIRFAGERVILMDAVALGLLRRELIDTIGLAGARGVMMRFGFAHGWRAAETLKRAFPWDSAREWQLAGGRLHMLSGHVVFEPVPHHDGRDAPFAEGIWRDSYEAQQHLHHVGLSDEPVCWSLTGFASGYLSAANGREIYCRETRCVAKGDPHCELVGMPREAWGDELADELALYSERCLQASLRTVTLAIEKAERTLKARRRELASMADDDEVAPGIIARSEAMRRVVDLARRVAAVDATALVTGESGVGKERIAQLIHQESPRRAEPFVAVNCGAVSETLLESELFGHARGSFTGAHTDRAGLFEGAHGGTLFLDEVGELTPAMQVKLLRVLQEREIRRVGETRARSVDVRVVAATHRNLADEVAAGRFRQDLYYRLRVVEVLIPALRHRKDDVLPLARTSLDRHARRFGRELKGFTPEAADQLLRYDWPGNVRELENATERAAVLADRDRVELRDLPEEVRSTAAPVALPSGAVKPLRDIEREYILASLARNAGNQSRTAHQLGIGTATLYRKLREYDRENRS